MYCFSCGAKIDDDLLICPKCGNRTDHYHQEKPSQQSAFNTSNNAATPQHYAQATQQYAQTTSQESAWATSPSYVQTASQESAWATPQQYAEATPQHYAQTASQQYGTTAPIGSSTLQGPSLQSSQLDVKDFNAYTRRMEIKHSAKSKRVALVLAIFFGYLGIHRFYLGKIGTGIIWFLTGGAFVFGWFLDIGSIVRGSMTDSQGRKLV